MVTVVARLPPPHQVDRPAAGNHQVRYLVHPGVIDKSDAFLLRQPLGELYNEISYPPSCGENNRTASPIPPAAGQIATSLTYNV